MELLALRPGPLVGKARKFVLDLRMDQGVMGRDQVIAELRRWAESEGIQLPPAAGT
jgi:poly(A) polymerase